MYRDPWNTARQFSTLATVTQVVKLGLPFGVGSWYPVNFEDPRPRLRWRWGYAWQQL